MGIKHKVFIGVITILIISSFFGITTENICAQENRSKVSFLGEPTYTLTNKITKNNEVIGRTYLIEIRLQNQGDERSENLLVNITDEEGFTLDKEIYIDPGEVKTVSFTWSTLLNRDQIISASFFPSDLNTGWNHYNSGSKTFTIKMDDTQDSLTATNTPGFELTIVAFAVILLIFIYRKRQVS